MKSAVKFIIAGALFYLVFLVSEFPARTAYALMGGVLQAQGVPLKLYALEGSLWKGSAVALTYENQRFDKVNWEFMPAELLAGKLAAKVSFRNPDSSASALVARSFFGGISVNNAKLNMNAQDLITMLKIPAVKLGGSFSVNLPELKLGSSSVESVQGRLLWSSAESLFPQRVALGDLFADFSTNDEGVVSAKLGDGGGPLEVNGTLAITPDGNYNVTGEFAAREGRNSALGRSLGFMGRYDANGKVAINKAGSLSEFGFLFK